MAGAFGTTAAAAKSGIFAPGSTAIGDFIGAPLISGLHAMGLTSAATEPTDPIGKAEFEGIFGSGSWDDPVVHADLAMALHGTPTAYGKVDKGMLGDYMDTRHYDTFAVGTHGADPSGTTPSTTTKKDDSKSSTVVLSPSGSRSSVPTGTAGYPYLIPPAFDFSGPANMPYTRNYWETHGLPMGLLEYVYPGPGSGYTDFTGGDPFATGGLLGGRSSGLLGDVPRVLPGGRVTGSSTAGVVTAKDVADKKEAEKKEDPDKDPDDKSDFEEHYPDDRGHDVGMTSAVYDDAPPTFVPVVSEPKYPTAPVSWLTDPDLSDKEFIDAAKKTAAATKATVSKGEARGRLEEAAPDMSGYSKAVSDALRGLTGRDRFEAEAAFSYPGADFGPGDFMGGGSAASGGGGGGVPGGGGWGGIGGDYGDAGGR
jgi:hypothetical protein